MDIEYVYEHGQPFEKVLANNLREQINQRIDIHKPSAIVIDGAQGEGKTTLAVQIMDYVNSLKGLPEITLGLKDHPQLSLGGEEFTKNFRICKKENYPIIAYDEAGDFSKRGAISSFNARLIRRFETMRSSNIIVVLILPTMASLDNHFWDLRVVRGSIHLKDRTINQGNFFAYSGYEIGWLRYWFSKLPLGLKYTAYDRCMPAFRGHFKNLPPKRADLLAKLSDYGKDRADMDAEIKQLGLLTYKDLAVRISMSVAYVKKAIYELKIFPDRKLKKVNYFKKEVLDILIEYKDSHGNMK